MKRPFFTITLLIGLCMLLCNCLHRIDSTTLLAEAECLMHEYPDSALKIIESIQHPEQLTDKEQADYALLLTQIHSYNSIPASSDSLIRVAVNYYQTSNEKEQKVKSQLFLGGVYLDMKDYTKAVFPLKQAEEEAKNFNNTQLQSLIYQHLGCLNQATGNYNAAYSYYMQSFHVLYTNQAYHFPKWKWNEKILMNILSLPLPEITDHIHINVDSLQRTIISCSLRLTPEIEHHNIGIRLTFNKTETLPPFIFWNLTSIPHTLENSEEMIDSLYLPSLHHTDLGIQLIAYKTLYKKKIKEGLYQEATIYMEEYERAIKTFHEHQESTQIQRLQQQYDKKILIRKHAETENLLYRIILGFITLLLIISIIGFKFHFKQKQKKHRYIQEIQEQISQIISLSDEKEQMETEILRLQYMLSQNKAIDQESIAIKQWGTLADIKSLGLYLRLTQTPNSYYPQSELPSLMHWLDLSSSNFATRLKEKYPELTSAEMNLCCLQRMGYSLEQIASIMHIKETSIIRNIYRACIHLGITNNKEVFSNFISSF